MIKEIITLREAAIGDDVEFTENLGGQWTVQSDDGDMAVVQNKRSGEAFPVMKTAVLKKLIERKRK